ncbi:wd-repeat protein [Phyllosticta citribraziliensis]|uniref:Wd-repeat protein n=1 Tax=Phyllosticta citribraziliensis TaxID=989973 RepID=A0ABR1LC19_9PEZI
MVPTAPNQRLNELLEQIRGEFENEVGRAGEMERQLAQQLQEMDLVRQKIYQLEQSQIAMKAKYEEEIQRLNRSLDAAGAAPHPNHANSSQHGNPSQPPPSIGHGQGTLFGGIMSQSGGGPGLAPPPPESAQAQNLPPHAPQGPPGLNPAAPGPPQHPFGGGYQPAPNGYPQAPQPTASPGPGKPRPGRGPPGPPTPQQNTAAPYPGSPQVARPTPPPGQLHAEPHNPLVTPAPPNVGNSLAELDPDQVPPNYKREGTDWFAIFNPRTRRVLDVDLVHTLPHDSVVCCVRFSADGRYVATGCNRSAQIFDVQTGEKRCVLQDASLNDEGDLYIRSVCFSPDGKYLATGAEDKVIRVWDIATCTITATFSGHDQDIYSLDFARNGYVIASGSGDRTVRLWDLNARKQIFVLSIEDGVTTVAMSPDNRFVAAGSLDKSVRVWDVTTGYLCERLEGDVGHKDSVYSVAFAPNGKDLVSGSLDKTIKMWELSTPPRMIPAQIPKGGKCIKTFEGHKDFVLSVALTPDGSWVLSGSKDRGVQFWDPQTGVAQLMLQGHKNSVISVAPSPMGNLFATGSGDMRARIWRYVTLKDAPLRQHKQSKGRKRGWPTT